VGRHNSTLRRFLRATLQYMWYAIEYIGLCFCMAVALLGFRATVVHLCVVGQNIGWSIYAIFMMLGSTSAVVLTMYQIVGWSMVHSAT
jgi:hypothetical protein